MTKSKKILFTTILAAIVAVSGIGMYSASIIPSALNGYHTDYTDAEGVRHISYGDPTGDHSLYHGVVTYVGKHADGTTFLIAQSHNTRTVQGINCAEQILFNGLSTGKIDTNGTNVCKVLPAGGGVSSAKFNGFRYIGLINGSSTTAATMNGSDTYTTSVIGGSRASSHGGIITVGLTNQGSPLNSTVAGTATYNQITITSPAFTFTGDAAAGTIIRGAVLLNATSGTPAMFAENGFTGVSLASSDTITITWTITLS